MQRAQVGLRGSLLLRSSVIEQLVAREQGTLFVAGLSECGSEFHLGTLLSLPKHADHHPVWPESKRYIHICKEKWQQSLAKILADNDFELIIIVNLLRGKKLTQHKGLADALRTTVTVKGTASV